MHQLPEGVWTPKLVGDELIAATRFINRTGGRVGPAAVKSAWPEFSRMNDPDFDGWPPMASDEPTRLTLSLTPRRVSQIERVIEWQGRYVADAQPGAGRVLKVWIRTRLTKKMTFERACELLGWSRATAYRGRDKALATIAMGLTAEGVIYSRH